MKTLWLPGKFWMAIVLGCFLLTAGGRVMAQRPVGLDVSSYQGSAHNPPTTVNWPSVKSANWVFGWAKATEGGTVNDPDFTYNITNAKAAGVICGAYHFAHPELNSPSTESSHFWSVAGAYIKADNLTFQPMLDMERFSAVTGASSFTDWANQWCTTISNNAAAVGVRIKPIIYVSACNAGNFNTGIATWWADIADYNSESAQSGTAWSTCTGDEEWGSGVWNVWQYSSSGSVSGVSGGCDVDVFNGTSAQLTSTMVATAYGPKLTTQPTNVTVTAGSNVTFTVAATGTGTIHYQWKLNGGTISGATTTKYTISNVKTINAGGYSVAATDNIGTTPSQTAFLSVLGPLTNLTGSVVAPPNLVNWWTADGNAQDMVGTANGTPQGGFSYAAGETGLAFDFDGSTAVISTGAADLAVPWTVCLWVKRQTTSQTSAGILEDGTYSLKLEQYQNTHEVGLSVLAQGDYVFSPAYTVPTGTWTHLAFVGTSTGTTFYANGVSAGSLTNSIPLPRAYIGAGYITSSVKYVDFMLGEMDEIMIFNRALSSTEIHSLYTAGSEGIVRAPQFTGIIPLSGGRYQLNFEALTAKNYSVYSSTNFINWTKLGSGSNPDGTNHFTDASATNAHAFYRISQP